MVTTSSLRQRLATALMFASLTTALVLPGHALAHAADGRPARIHEGSCEATGAAAHQLTGVGATVSLEGTPIAEPEMTGAEDATGLDISETTIAESLDHLTGEPHAIVVYESDTELDHTIVCGNIGGPTTTDGALAVWLSPTNGGEDQGLALLRPDGDNLSITIYLAEPGEDEHEHEHDAAAEATPGS